MSTKAIRPFGGSAIAVALGVAFSLSLAGCGGVKEAVGLGKKKPDEYASTNNAPLTMPPGFNLRPPEAGAASTGAFGMPAPASQALGPAPRGESRALTPAGDASQGADDLAERLMFWQKQTAGLSAAAGEMPTIRQRQTGMMEGVIDKVF
jgi:hypothetical protein